MLLAASFCQQVATMSAYKFSPRAVASPDAPQKRLVRKRARSGGVKWVQVSQDEPVGRPKSLVPRGGRLPTVLMRPPPQLSVKTWGGGGGELGGGSSRGSGGGGHSCRGSGGGVFLPGVGGRLAGVRGASSQG